MRCSLLSEIPGVYERRKSVFLEKNGREQRFEKYMITDRLKKKLIETPFIVKKLAQLQADPQATKDIRSSKLTELQKIYDDPKVYTALHSKTMPHPEIQVKIQKLLQEVKDL